MAGRKRHSAQDIVRKLRRADELSAAGKTGEEIAAELGVSPATLYNWRRTYGGMDTDPPRNSRCCASRTVGSSGCWLRPSRRKTLCVRWPRENSEPGCQASRRRRAQGHVAHVGAVGMQGRWAGSLHLPTPPGCTDSCGS
jgi:transposase-like protein